MRFQRIAHVHNNEKKTYCLLLIRWINNMTATFDCKQLKRINRSNWIWNVKWNYKYSKTSVVRSKSETHRNCVQLFPILSFSARYWEIETEHHSFVGASLKLLDCVGWKLFFLLLIFQMLMMSWKTVCAFFLSQHVKFQLIMKVVVFKREKRYKQA